MLCVEGVLGGEGVLALIALHTLGQALTVHSFDFTFYPPSLPWWRSSSTAQLWAEFPVEVPCLRDRNSLLCFSPPPMIITPTEERFLRPTTGKKKTWIEDFQTRTSQSAEGLTIRLNGAVARCIHAQVFPANQQLLRVSGNDWSRSFRVSPAQLTNSRRRKKKK